MAAPSCTPPTTACVSLGCNPAANPSFGTYLSEIGWNEGPTGDFSAFFRATEASGGGYSTVWKEPAYQQGTIHGGKQRAVPDVAYNGAILHGVLTYLNIPGVAPGFYRFGGTSCGSPQWSALTAIADQAAGHDYGFINAALYKVGQNSGPYASAFHDITSGEQLRSSSTTRTIRSTSPDSMPGRAGTPSPVSVRRRLAACLASWSAFWSAGQGNAAITNS